MLRIKENNEKRIFFFDKIHLVISICFYQWMKEASVKVYRKGATLMSSHLLISKIGIITTITIRGEHQYYQQEQHRRLGYLEYLEYLK